MPGVRHTGRRLAEITSRILKTYGGSLWLRVGLVGVASAIVLVAAGRTVDAGRFSAALSEADLSYVAAALLVVAATIAFKAVRWWLLLRPAGQSPSILQAFWSLALGQLVNTLVPLRLGEMFRAYTLKRQARTRITHSLGTIVIEKTLDAITLAATLLAVLPVAAVPQVARSSELSLLVVALVGGGALFLISRYGDRLFRRFQQILAWLPAGVERWLSGVALGGVEALAALRSWSLTAFALLASALVGVLAVLTPWVLFSAFGLALGLKAAIALNLVVSIGSIPPSTPGKIIVFEALAVLTLRQLGVTDNAVAISYAVVYHLTVFLPQLIFGTVAIARIGWNMRWISASRIYYEDIGSDSST